MSRDPRFTDEQKLKILHEVEEHGLAVTLRKHKLYAKSIYRWREKLQTTDRVVEEPKRAIDDAEMKRLRQENQQLKELVAEKELTIRIKDALLKKQHLARGTVNGRTSLYRQRCVDEHLPLNRWNQSQHVLLSTT